MKKEKKVLICSVLNHLAQRDPWWKNNPNAQRKFKEIYAAWRTTELRHKHRNPQFFTVAWKRGWLSIDEFVRFREYAMQ